MLLSPGDAGAALSLRIGPNTGNAIDGPSSGQPGVYFLDLTFDESGRPEHEGLYTYDLSVRLVRPSGASGGVRLVTGPDVFSTASPGFVFPPGLDPRVRVRESDADHVFLNVSSGVDPPEGTADVNTGDTAGRLFYVVEAGAPFGDYRLVFEPDTMFLSGDPERPLEIPVDLSDAGVIRWPEPTGLALLAVGAVFLLRPGHRGGRRPRTDTGPN